jgi:hypothetical protein
MKVSAWILTLVLAVTLVPAVMAQTVTLDLDTSTEGVQTSIQAQKGDKIVALLVVEDAANMAGVSVDVTFDATNALDLQKIYELPGDLDFSSRLDVDEEVIPVANEFVAEFKDTERTLDSFTDGFGRNSGVVVDADANDRLTSDEAVSVINAFVAQFKKIETRTIYWTTEIKESRPSDEHNESVEVFDPPAYSNTDGQHPGLIDDITVVLLRRPDRDRADFGYTGDAIVATLEFEVKSDAAAGVYQFGFPQAVWINNMFDDLGDVMDLTVPATLPSVEVTE